MSISWIISSIPWWFWVILAGVLLAMFWQTLVPIWFAIPARVRHGLAILGGGVLAYLAGRNRGKKDAEAVEAERNAQAQARRDQVNKNVDSASDTEVKERLSKWNRD